VTRKGRLQPGKMLLVDTLEGRIVDDKELKMTTARRQPFANWVANELLRLPDIMAKERAKGHQLSVPLDESSVSTDPRLLAEGYSFEQLDLLLRPLVNEGKEALGSMGNDAPLACMATAPRLAYDYFRQLFAQVTNPPIDPIREAIVMSLDISLGNEGNLLEMSQAQASRLHLTSPVLSVEETEALKKLGAVYPAWQERTIDTTFAKDEGVAGYAAALERVCAEVTQAVEQGVRVVVLSDRALSADRVALSSAVATGGVHHHLVRTKQRSKIALVVESADAREVHHVCVLIGYGADAVCPWLCFEALLKIRREGLLKVRLLPPPLSLSRSLSLALRRAPGACKECELTLVVVSRSCRSTLRTSRSSRTTSPPSTTASSRSSPRWASRRSPATEVGCISPQPERGKLELTSPSSFPPSRSSPFLPHLLSSPSFFPLSHLVDTSSSATRRLADLRDPRPARRRRREVLRRHGVAHLGQRL